MQKARAACDDLGKRKADKAGLKCTEHEAHLDEEAARALAFKQPPLAFVRFLCAYAAERRPLKLMGGLCLGQQ